MIRNALRAKASNLCSSWPDILGAMWGKRKGDQDLPKVWVKYVLQVWTGDEDQDNLAHMKGRKGYQKFPMANHIGGMSDCKGQFSPTVCTDSRQVLMEEGVPCYRARFISITI